MSSQEIIASIIILPPLDSPNRVLKTYVCFFLNVICIKSFEEKTKKIFNEKFFFPYSFLKKILFIKALLNKISYLITVFYALQEYNNHIK